MNLTKEQTEARLAEVNRLLAPLNDERFSLEHHLLELQTDIRPGDLVEWRLSDTQTRRGRVLAIRWWVGQPMFRVVCIRKDGSEGSEADVTPYHKAKKIPDWRTL